jgi:hypothetical protein
MPISVKGGESGMGIHRIAILCATFFMVALLPRIEMALVVFAFGLSLYAALWCRDIFKEKGKQ